MEATFYLVVQGRPVRGYKNPPRFQAGTIRTTKRKPDTARDEVAVRVDLDIPDSFYVRPELNARITVPDQAAAHQPIDADVADDIAAVIQEQFGIRLVIDAPEPEATTEAEKGEHRRAPWDDHEGNPIYEGDTIRHPNGDEAKVVHVEGYPDPQNEWLAIYGPHPNVGDHGFMALLVNQVGEKGKAVVVARG